MKSLLLVPLLVPTALFSAKADIKLAEALGHSVEAEGFIAQLQEGFHFNEKAPNSVSVDGLQIQPTELKYRSIKFGLPDKYQEASANLYICDDALTFCKAHRVEFGKGQNKVQNSAKSPGESKKPESLKLNSHGFFEGDIQLAAEKAKKEGKLLLIDFAARWCPGCVRLEQEVFPTKGFKKNSQAFVKLKVDLDRMENSVLAEKFNVKAIPTLLVATPALKEVSRLIDYQPQASVSGFLTAGLKDPLPLDELEAKASKGDIQAAQVLANRFYSAGQYEKSIEFFDLAQVKPPVYTEARVRVAYDQREKDPKQKPGAIKTLSAAIGQEPQSSRSIRWRSLLIPLLKDAKAQQRTLQEGLELVSQLQEDSEKLKAAFATDEVGEFSQYEPLLLAWYKVDLLNAAKASEDEISKAQKKATETGEDLKIPASATGPSLRVLIFMTAAKQYDKAEKLAREMLKADPNNPEIQRRLIRVLNAQEKFDKAIPIAQKSLENSYGRNQIWVARMLAEAYLGAKQREKASSLITSYLAKPELGWKSMKEEKDKFEELRKSL